MYMSHFSSDELIFHKVGNEIISAGFGINSILLNQGLSPLLSFTRDYDTSSSESDSNSDSDSDSDSEKPRKKVFKSYKNLAIPIGLYLNEEKKKSIDLDKSNDNNKTDKDKNKNKNKMDNEEHIADDIYDQLLKLIYYNEKDKRKSKKMTKKYRKSKTYKNRK